MIKSLHLEQWLMIESSHFETVVNSKKLTLVTGNDRKLTLGTLVNDKKCTLITG